MPIERAAEYVGRKKSWGYQQEQKRQLTGGEPAAIRGTYGPGRPSREASWKDAVDLIVALDDEDQTTAERLRDTFGLDLLRMVAHIASYLAHVQTLNTQNHFLELHDEEPWWDEIKGNPIVTRDILQAIPDAVEKWEQRLLEAHPDFKLIDEEMAKAEDTDDPGEAHRELRRRIKAGDFDPEHLKEPQPAASNGHH